MKKIEVANGRQYDLDWIRVFATLAVFLYHCSMFFNPFPWHVKNNVLDSDGILVFSLYVGSWLMPLFFAVSGIAVVYTLKKRDTKTYIRERLVRICVPLIFGVVLLTAPQVYIERITNNQFQGSFFDFLPHFFDGIYLSIGGTGNFAFFGLHLWYLLVLLVFSLLTLPLFKRIHSTKKFGLLHFFILPLFLYLVGFIETVNLGGWDITFYLVVFISGFYFFANEGFKPALKQTIAYHLSIAILTSIIYISWFMIELPAPGSIADSFLFLIQTLNCWSWLLCIFYLGERYLTSSNRFLKYGSEASMPFYILHQPVIVLLGYQIYDLAWPLPVKILILVTASLAIILICYHYVIRRINILRFLFGIKGRENMTVSTIQSKTTFK